MLLGEHVFSQTGKNQTLQSSVFATTQTKGYNII